MARTIRPTSATIAFLQIRDPLSRLDGMGNVNVFGAREYSMRVWLDPDKMYRSKPDHGRYRYWRFRGRTCRWRPGVLGAEPAPPGTELQLTINTEGRLVTPDQFGQIIVKRGDNGEIVYLADVGRVELGAKDYNVSSYLDGKPAVALAIFQLPGSNAVKTAHEVRATDEKAVQVFSRPACNTPSFTTRLNSSNNRSRRSSTHFLKRLLWS